MDLRDAAAILGVAQDATVEEVRSAYRAHVRIMHPDRLAGAPETDQVTAHRAMARINEASEVFEKHFRMKYSGPAKPQESRPSQAPPKPPPDRRDTIVEFRALLSHPFGWDLSGTLRVVEVDGQRIIPEFHSDDVDARGAPLINGAVDLLPGTKATRDGRLPLRGGGYLLIYGGKPEADFLMEYVDENLDGTGPPVWSRPPPFPPRSSGRSLFDRIMNFGTSGGSGYGWYRGQK